VQQCAGCPCEARGRTLRAGGSARGAALWAGRGAARLCCAANVRTANIKAQAMRWLEAARSRARAARDSPPACAQAGAAAAVAAGRPRLGSALFCLALNHKQMALYFAPAFFAHLLGCALRLPGPAAKARGPARGTPAVATPPARKHGRRRAHAARA